MVCLGNICRSPLAEGIMRQLIKDKQLNWEVASAGTGDWHVGQAPDRRSIEIAKAYGYDIAAQRARHFTAASFAQFDYIFVMDKNNLKDVLSLAKNEEEHKKVKLFLSQEAEVTDPYYDQRLFDPVCKQVEERCKALLNELSREV